MSSDSRPIAISDDEEESDKPVEEVQIPPKLTAIFGVNKLLAKIDIDNINEICKAITDTIAPEYYDELAGDIAYYSWIFHKKFSAFVSLLHALSLKIPAFQRVILKSCNSYLLIRALFNKGLFSRSDIEKLLKKGDRACYFFEPEFGAAQAIKHMAYFKDFIEDVKDAGEGVTDQLISDGYPRDFVQYAIKNDDVDRLNQMMSKGQVDLKEKYTVSPYEWFSIPITFRPESYNNRKYPLQMAAYYGSYNCFKFLLEKGATVYDCVMYDALASHDKSIVKLCKKHPTFLKKAEKLTIAVKYHITERYDFDGNQSRSTYLRQAISSKNYEVFTMNLKRKFDYADIITAIDNGILSMCEFMISRGLSANIKDADGKTPLMYAASRSQAKICKFLIDNGADINAKDEEGTYVVHYAAIYADIATLNAIYSPKWNLNVRTKLGYTPLSLSSFYKKNKEHKWFKSKGATLNYTEKTKK